MVCRSHRVPKERTRDESHEVRPGIARVAAETAAKIRAGAYSEAQKQVAEEIKNGKYGTPEEAEAATAAAKVKDAHKAYEAYQSDAASAMVRIVEEAEKQK